MKRSLSVILRRLVVPALALAGAVLAAGSARAQIVDSTCAFCPQPEIEAAAQTREVRVDWMEIPVDEGRRVSNVVKLFEADSLGLSAAVDLAGDYVGACDVRLIVTKIPQDPALDVNVRLIYRTTTNISGTGGDLARDTLDVYDPGVTYDFDPAIAGNLSITFGPNVVQPATPLGSVPVTLSGLNTTISPTTNYRARALNSVTSLSQGLQVEVAGPLPIPPGETARRTRTLTVTTPGQRFPIMEGMYIAFGDGAAAVGDSTTWEAHYLFPSSGRVRADLESIDGYRVWRSQLPDTDAFTLLGEIRQCTGPFEFVLLNEDEISVVDLELRYDPAARHYTLFDRDVHDDFPYRYAVSTFDRGFLGNPEGLTFEGALAKTPKLYPARTSRLRSRQAIVVPNPYDESAAWEETSPKVVFSNLPTEAVIRVFTVSAEHVATIEHGPGRPRSTSATSAFWDLRSDVGSRIAAGIYVFYIEGTDRYERDLGDGATETVTEPFQQTGKLIVIR